MLLTFGARNIDKGFIITPCKGCHQIISIMIHEQIEAVKETNQVNTVLYLDSQDLVGKRNTFSVTSDINYLLVLDQKTL